jgi:mono/diheme cytochrome c family protein
MPKIFIYLSITLVALAMIPPALIARARTRTTQARRIHIFQDMDNQAKFRAQHANPLFADGRAMRPPVAGTVARSDTADDPHFVYGIVGSGWAESVPPQIEVSMPTLERGRDRFTIFCTPCHGHAGYGDGIIHLRADQLVTTGKNGTVWVPPKNIHEAEIREQPLGQIYNTITNGVRNMAGYESQIPTDDRWAIALYVKALQRSQTAERSDGPGGPYPEKNLLPPPEEDQQ